MQCTTVNQISIRPIANHVLGPYRHEEIANVSHVLLYFLLPFTPLLVSYPSCRFPYAFLSCSSSYSAILLLFPLPPLMLHLFSYSSLLVSSTSFLFFYFLLPFTLSLSLTPHAVFLTPSCPVLLLPFFFSFLFLLLCFISFLTPHYWSLLPHSFLLHLVSSFSLFLLYVFVSYLYIHVLHSVLLSASPSPF